MRVLVAGNSHASVLRLSLTEGLLEGRRIRPDFHVMPGGDGPYFIIENGRIAISPAQAHLPAYVDPPEVQDRLLAEYEAVVVSALGYVHGGFLYRNPITRQGLVADFQPRSISSALPLISRSCFRDIVGYALRRQPGFAFLRQVRDHFLGRLMVQPVPYPSDYLKHHAKWESRVLYEKPIEFHRFLYEIRDETLRNLCSEIGADLLDPTIADPDGTHFTPHRMMRSDGVHPRPEYGALVLHQVLDRFAAPP